MRLVRKMRGGGQAHLIQADDRNFYVVKFLENPQHRRAIVNEWIASAILKHLRISTPEVALVQVTEQFLAENPNVYIQLGKRRAPVSSGWHFGSRLAGDPASTVIYDLLPVTLLEAVHNLAQFRAVFVFDKWLANADSRQAVFFRGGTVEARKSAGTNSSPRGFIVQMIDHGQVFSGAEWRLADSPLRGLYFPPVVYREVRSLDDFQPWMERVAHFPEQVIYDAVRQIPTPWIEEDEKTLGRLLDRLLTRSRRVARLVEDSRAAQSHVFPNWPG